MLATNSRVELLHELLDQRILVIDGSMGALILSHGLTERDYRGERFADHAIDLKNANDLLCLSRPDFVEQIHREYIDAGADIIETNTFNANTISLEEFGLADLTGEINRRAGELARASVLRAEDDDGRIRFCFVPAR